MRKIVRTPKPIGPRAPLGLHPVLHRIYVKTGEKTLWMVFYKDVCLVLFDQKIKEATMSLQENLMQLPTAKC